MNSAAKKFGFSLIELLVALGIIAVLVGLALPAIKAMQKSYDSTGAESMISTALATARTLAISKQRYAGIRFQEIYSKDGPLNADQYMIFIVYQPLQTGVTVTDMFKAIEGYKPMKLPENMGVMDMKLGNSADFITSDDQINDDSDLTDITTFSVIFSPSGKLVNHLVQTRNGDGKSSGTDSNDTVFNTLEKINAVVNPAGQFLQDDDQEESRNRFIIYDRDKFSKLNKDERYSNYLKELKEEHMMYINAYTGEIIK